MPLRHLLFRCPFCGHDPMEGEADHASCAGCGRTFERTRVARLIRVRRDTADGIFPIADLVSRMESGDGAIARAERGEPHHSASARERRSTGEEPAYLDGQVIGFFERMTEGEDGTLVLRTDGLEFAHANGTNLWPFARVRALQTASASVQISLEDGSVVQFEFEDDSPYRWEQLLRSALNAWFEEQGRGRILEYSPRITTRS